MCNFIRKIKVNSWENGSLQINLRTINWCGTLGSSTTFFFWFPKKFGFNADQPFKSWFVCAVVYRIWNVGGKSHCIVRCFEYRTTTKTSSHGDDDDVNMITYYIVCKDQSISNELWFNLWDNIASIQYLNTFLSEIFHYLKCERKKDREREQHVCCNHCKWVSEWVRGTCKKVSQVENCTHPNAIKLNEHFFDYVIQEKKMSSSFGDNKVDPRESVTYPNQISEMHMFDTHCQLVMWLIAEISLYTVENTIFY